ncbi:hypothetical protein QAD02_015485 [Eretmocerus hayati]|uniref:Uncharacterized protein n=1 Tax=Eretmocerus hayati TaxID=131215 RepID=A0ACC2P9D5_9HYME|nr:hypothetical protein QAD02_015485 [Eretmocerus hayati]
MTRLIFTLTTYYFIIGATSSITSGSEEQTQVQETQSRLHLVVGSRQRGDKLLQQVHVRVESAAWFGFGVDYAKTFPGDGVSRITQLKMYDRNAEEDESLAALVLSGGPDFRYVTIAFKSLFSRFVDFDIEIYGKRVDK